MNCVSDNILGSNLRSAIYTFKISIFCLSFSQVMDVEFLSHWRLQMNVINQRLSRWVVVVVERAESSLVFAVGPRHALRATEQAVR